MAVLQEQLGEHERWVFTWRGMPVIRTKTKAWDAAVKRAKCPAGLRWHDLRHTWATWHVMAGTPLEVLMKLGGWASYEMVLRYAHFAPGYLAEYAARVGTKTGTVVPAGGDLPAETPPESVGYGVADGIRTHDDWNHKPRPANVVQLDQELTKQLRAARRLKTG